MQYSNVGDTGDNEGKQAAFREKNVAANLDAKAKFAKNLYRLSGMELGHVLHVLDIRSPQALVQPDPSVEVPEDKFSEETELEINVDAIDSRTFTELDRYVKEKMKARSNGAVEEEEDDVEGSARKKKRTS